MAPGKKASGASSHPLGQCHHAREFVTCPTRSQRRIANFACKNHLPQATRDFVSTSLLILPKKRRRDLRMRRPPRCISSPEAELPGTRAYVNTAHVAQGASSRPSCDVASLEAHTLTLTCSSPVNQPHPPTRVILALRDASQAASNSPGEEDSYLPSTSDPSYIDLTLLFQRQSPNSQRLLPGQHGLSTALLALEQISTKYPCNPELCESCCRTPNRCFLRHGAFKILVSRPAIVASWQRTIVAIP